MSVDPEHLTKEAFDKMYEQVPPWEIGRPQPEMLALLEAGEIDGRVLDIGCATGELSLEMARRGLFVVGIDSSPKAIERAKAKAAVRGLAVEFHLLDALCVDMLGRAFDVAIDCGLFHVFTDAERLVYATALSKVVRPAGKLIVLCFSEHETREGGPRRVTQDELRATFADGWRFESIRAARFDSLIHPGGAAAWLSILRRTS